MHQALRLPRWPPPISSPPPGCRADPNLLWLHYEDLQEDLPAAVSLIAEFLGIGQHDPALQALAVERSTIGWMKRFPEKWVAAGGHSTALQAALQAKPTGAGPACRAAHMPAPCCPLGAGMTRWGVEPRHAASTMCPLMPCSLRLLLPLLPLPLLLGVWPQLAPRPRAWCSTC